MEDSLDRIGIRHGTDKSSASNDFLSFYEPFIAGFRKRATRVLEIGVLDGASARTWRDYFPNARVVAVDIDAAAKRHEGERISVEIADQSNPVDLARISALGPFDLIVDDGSHVWEHQILSLNTLFPSLTPGGIYILEDLDTSFGRYRADYMGRGGPSAADYLKALSDWVVGCRVLDDADLTDDALRALWPDIEFVCLSRGTSVLRRWGAGRQRWT